MKENILDKFSLKNKVVVITGTTRGLGEALVEGLLESGAKVIALDRSEKEHLKKYSDVAVGSFTRVKVDLLAATRKELEEIIAKIVRKFGRIDVLINNAGITRRGEVAELTEKDWHDVLLVNLTVPFYLSQIAAKYFIKQRSGKIINLASMLSYQGGVRVPSYTSSKHGVVGLTRSLAVGLAKYGINVNAIAPGFMATDMTIPLQQDSERNAAILSRIPAGRWGKADDLKGLVVFLASAASDYLNGVVIPVDGGWLAA
jgi:2-deoxy-D-gluconate 3-dehydrogenase